MRCDVVETQRYNHAREEVARLPLATLQGLDGIVAVGGDGLFQEVLNGALAIRCPWVQANSRASRLACSAFRTEHSQPCAEVWLTDKCASRLHTRCTPHHPFAGEAPLWFGRLTLRLCATRADEGDRAVLAASMRLGHIPAGSTDAVAYSLNGTRSQQTAALHIAIGDRYGYKHASCLRTAELTDL